MSDHAEANAASRAFAIVTLGVGLIIVFLLWGASSFLKDESPRIQGIEIPPDAGPGPVATASPEPAGPQPAEEEGAEAAAAQPSGRPAPTSELELLRAEIERLKAEHEAARAESSRELERIERHARLLEDRLREVVQKKTMDYAEQGRPDGKVVRLAKDGRAWIDLGFRHGLLPGTRFQAFRRDSAGAVLVTAVLQVVEVGADQSACLDLETTLAGPNGTQRTLPDAATPLKKGDQVRNPFFDREEGQVLVVIGDRLKSEEHSLAEVFARVEGLGGRIDPQLSVDTDVLVLLADPPAEVVQRAAFYGVMVLRERELLEFVGLN